MRWEQEKHFVHLIWAILCFVRKIEEKTIKNIFLAYVCVSAEAISIIAFVITRIRKRPFRVISSQRKADHSLCAFGHIREFTWKSESSHSFFAHIIGPWHCLLFHIRLCYPLFMEPFVVCSCFENGVKRYRAVHGKTCELKWLDMIVDDATAIQWWLALWMGQQPNNHWPWQLTIWNDREKKAAIS